MFELASGILAVTLITAYAIYILFFANRGSVTINTRGNGVFEEGDVINLTGTTTEGQYRVIKINGEQLTLKPRNWFG